MAHVNTAKVQTTEGTVELTKTSTHRSYVAASAIQFTDGTQLLLSWHLTTEAAVKYCKSAAAQGIARYEASKRGLEVQLVTFLPVTVTLTGKDAKKAQDEAPVAAPAAQDFVPQSEAEEAAQEATQPGMVTECRCQCGQQVSKGKFYKPGHDARHAGSVARLLVAGRTEGWDASSLNALVESLPTQALRSKALVQAHRLGEKAAAKAAK